MSSLLDPFILIKIACAIVIVVAASRAAERLGPFLGSMIALADYDFSVRRHMHRTTIAG